MWHDDVIKWKHLSRYWPFVRGIHRSPVNSTHKGQWRGALMFSLICGLNKHLSKQSLGWWFETPSRPLWRHGNDQPCCSVRANNTENFNIPLCWTLGRGTHQPSVDSPQKRPSVRKQDVMRQRFPSRDLALMVINVKRDFMGLYHHALSQCSFRQKWMPPLYQRN